MHEGLHLWEAARILRKSLGRRDGAALCGAAVCALAVSGMAAAAPVALKYLVDAVSENGLAGAGVLTGSSPAFWLAAYTGAMLAGRLAGEARSALFGAAEQSILRNLSRRAFAHVLALPMNQRLKRSAGEVVQTLENGLQGFRLILQHGLFTLLPGLVEITLIAVLLLQFFDAAFLGVFALCAAAYCLVFADGARRILRASRAVSSARIRASARLSDGLMNIETVKAFTGEARFAALFDEALADTQVRWRRYFDARLANGVLAALVFIAGLGAALWMAASRVQQGAMTAGDLVLINAWMLQLVRPMELLGYGLRDIGQGAAFIEKLQGLLREPAEPGLGPACAAPCRKDGPAAIDLENVSFAYGDGRNVLENVSIRIEAGQRVALVGPSGSGKSTLIRLLMKFHEPDDGQIRFNGQPLPDIPATCLREQTAFVSQDAGLFNESAAFNVAFPQVQADESRIREALERVGLEGVLERFVGTPGGSVGEGGARLSGGEKQRVAIARALLRKPVLLLADEPTSALDPASEAAVFKALRAASAGATMIVATHRLASITDADLILVMSGGRIVESGRHEALMAAGGVYAGMWKNDRR
jgi:ABC-type multidrug transport system fused ATPase/permease subunit